MYASMMESVQGHQVFVFYIYYIPYFLSSCWRVVLCMEHYPLKSQKPVSFQKGFNFYSVVYINKIIFNIKFNILFLIILPIWCIVRLDPADITHISRNQTVNETEEVTLNCSAKGMPAPSITWTRVSDNSPASFPLKITGKQDEGGFRCTARNGIGNPASQVVYIIVESKLKHCT